MRPFDILRAVWDNKFLYILLMNLFFNAFEVSSQVTSPFNLRYHTQQRGGIQYVANAILSCKGCDAVNELPPYGKGNNNDFDMFFVDVDEDQTTFNSSSASLNLPDCSSISFVGLYWGAVGSPTNPRIKEKNRVKLGLPGKQSYIDLVADQDLGNFRNRHYQYFKDITSLVHTLPSPNGTFTVGNIVTDQGAKDLYAGWTIVVVFKNDLLPSRDLSVFDGFVPVVYPTRFDLNIGGFQTPPRGPVSLDFGVVAYDGERGIGGDRMLINNKPVFDILHDKDNVFNSTIAVNGEVAKNTSPALKNTLGYDASIIHLENSDFTYLKNNETSLVVTLETVKEDYFVGVLTSAIDNFNPDFKFQSQPVIGDKGNALLVPGETASFEYNLKNIGNDKSSITTFIDTIPDSFDFIKGSFEVKYDNESWIQLSQESKGGRYIKYSWETKRIEASLGAIASGDSVKVRYRAQVTSDLDKIKCAGSIISKYAWLQYYGNINTNWFSKEPSAAVIKNNCSLEGPVNILFDTQFGVKDTAINIYCSGTPVSDLHLPTGYALYKSDDVSFQHPLDKLGGSGVYKAYRKLSTGCEYSFNVIARADSVTIYSQPDNIEATVGSGVAFSVGIKGENVSFQWQVNKGTGTWEDIAGATERSLTIPKVTEEMDGYNYRLRITTPCKDYLLSVKVVLSVKKQPVSKPSEEPEPQPEVKDENVGALFVPNAFMPASNTQELRNFVVKGHGLAKWQMTIFNKWDQVIWKTDVIGADGSPAESWDGKMFGADAPQGAYMWAIEAVFEDGKEWEGMSVRDSKPRKSGVVYLLR
ncbi:hypothetical protein [Pararcticibacter amylolyticus]|nr:hypothetical protein [Pararcticibacter amylolyticus]